MAKSRIAADLEKKSKELQEVVSDGAKYFQSITPKNTGNAKRHTKQVKNEIQANYPYATRLDNGSSKQAPQGMSKPTINHMRKLVRKIMEK